MAKIELPTISFNTQAQAKAFFKDMLARYAHGQTVAPEDETHLRGLVERHPEYATKTGCGVAHFEVRRNPPFPTKGFWIVRTDGTRTDFSYPTCIAGKPVAHRQDVFKALRLAIKPDIAAARKSILAQFADEDGRVVCILTGERITPDEAHLDHRPPKAFEALVETFMLREGLGWADVAIKPWGDGDVTTQLADADLVERFRAYHAVEADLCLVKAEANLSQGSGRNRRS